MRNSEKHGVAGASKAKSSPFRLVGGTPEHPRLFGATAQANSVRPADYSNMAHYHKGMIAGLMAARLGFLFQGSSELDEKLSS